jgi:hypothetical protein
MIGFRQVSEFEVDGKSFGDAVGIVNIKVCNNLPGLRQSAGMSRLARRGSLYYLLAMLDK